MSSGRNAIRAGEMLEEAASSLISVRKVKFELSLEDDREDLKESV